MRTATYFDFKSVRDQVKRTNQKTIFKFKFVSAEESLKITINNDWTTLCKEISCRTGFCEFHIFITIFSKNKEVKEIIKISIIYHENIPIAYVYFDGDSLNKLKYYKIIDLKNLIVIKNAPDDLSDYILETHE
jgi:hypothetical protein